MQQRIKPFSTGIPGAELSGSRAAGIFAVCLGFIVFDAGVVHAGVTDYSLSRLNGWTQPDGNTTVAMPDGDIEFELAASSPDAGSDSTAPSVVETDTSPASEPGLFTVAAAPGAATSINFGSTINAANLRSDGSDMDVTFTFQMGVFEEGFLPVSGNLNQWLQRWIPLSDENGDPASAPYLTINIGGGIFSNNFEGTAQITDNVTNPSDPFAPGTDSYLWGYNVRQGVGMGEWILLSNNSWKLPVVDPASNELPPNRDWAVADTGTTAILGSVNPDYAPFGGQQQEAHMQTEAVDLTLLSIPEPSVAALLFVVLGCLSLIRRRRG